MSDDDIADIFAGLGPVTIRKLFGGKGIYHRGVIVAIELGEELMLKGDADTAPLFEQGGARRWTYQGKRTKPVAMPYWSIPEEAFDDPDMMTRWTRLAYAAAQRAK